MCWGRVFSAFPTTGKGNLEPVCFCFGELNGTCGHMHVFVLVLFAHTHTQTAPVFSLAEPKGVSISACLLLPQWWLLLCISNRCILVLSSWNETYSPKELKRREIGRVSERNMKSWVQRLPSRYFFFCFPFLRKSE